MLFVGGSNNDKTDFQPLVDKLYAEIADINYVSFSFIEDTDDERSFEQQIDDLLDVLDVTEKEFSAEEVIIFCTSMGAYPTTKIILDDQYSQLITEVIYFDPADFYIDDSQTNKNFKTWSGSEKYDPERETISSRLKNLKGNTRIHVVNSTLRNCLKDRYVEVPYQGEDTSDLYPRLSNKMVESFYLNTPKKNKGEYIETPLIPHVFLKHGYVEKNIHEMITILKKILKK
jgi:hypothetical protein